MGLVILCLPSLYTMDPNAKVIASYSCVCCVALNCSVGGSTATPTPAGLVTVAVYVASALLPTLRTTRRCVTVPSPELNTTEKAG